MGKNNKSVYFYIFLFINAICWILVQLIRNIISLDSMEAISWGELISFGTNKHPPLSGWLMAGFYNLFGQHDILVYILGQICIFTGAVFIYKLAKYFLSKEWAIISTMTLSTCIYYTYYIYVNSYNCNVVLMMLWPIVIYYFYKAISCNKISDWSLFGIFSGLAFLGKYQIVFLFMAMFIYLILFDRKQFRNKNMYLSILLGTVVILPHVIWLFNNDFFSFNYMLDRTQSQTHNMPALLAKLGSIIYPIKFIADQLLAITSCIIIYLLTALYAKNIQTNLLNKNDKNKWFLIIVGLFPIILQGLMGTLTSARVPGMWGTIMVSILPLLIAYLFPVKSDTKIFSFAISLNYIALTLSLVFVISFALLNTQFYIAYPYQKIMKDFNIIWQKETQNATLKYVGGDMDYVYPFRTYNNHHPKVVLETFGHKNPWANYKDILHSGILVVGPSTENTLMHAKELDALIPESYTITSNEYIFKSCNKFHQCEDNKMYYVIIPPQK